MSKPSPARYRTMHWSGYTASLKKRGSLLIWLDKEMTWLARPDGRPGRPSIFSDAAIQFCLTIKVLFKLPLRQTTGIVASLLKLAGLDWAVPDDKTLCRRKKTRAVQIPFRRADGPLNLLVDSTGITFLGDGEWQARKHGIQSRRQSLPGNGLPANRERGRKVHLAMDTATSDIRAVEFTPGSEGDSPVLPEVLDQIHDREEIGTVTADGAYDTRHCHRFGAYAAPSGATVPYAHHRPPSHADHPDPQERTPLERGLPGRNRPKRTPACHPALRPGVLEALDGRPCPKPDRGQDAVPESLR
jgi:hypothetical protein